MPRAKGTPKTGGRKEGTPNKRTVEAEEMAKNALVNVGRELLDSPHAIVVIRKLGKDRLTEVEEMAMEEALSYREAARQGNVAAEMLFWKYLGLALEAAKARAPYESPRLAAVAVQEQPDEGRVITGESARERLLQVVLAVIAAEDAERAERAEKAIDVTPPPESRTEAETVVTPPQEDIGDGEAV